MRHKYIWILAFLLAITFGCSNHESQDAKLSLIKATDPSPTLTLESTKENLDLVQSVEHEIESMKELYDVAVIKGKEQILVAYKVKHLQRLHMKKIEKQMNKLLEEKYPDEDFIVSSDYKIFLETVELNEKMKDPDYTDEKANKRLEEIIKLKKEMT